MILFVDPGLDLGWAVFSKRRNKLQSSGSLSAPRGGALGSRIQQLIYSIEERVPIAAVDRIYIEEPAFFGTSGGYRTAARGDLIKLTLVAGAVAGHMVACGADLEFVPISRWKGQLPKRVVDKRLARHFCMSVNELSKLYPTSHERDAIAMGLVMLKEMSL